MFFLTWLFRKDLPSSPNWDWAEGMRWPPWPLKSWFERWRPMVGENLSWITPGPVPIPLPILLGDEKHFLLFLFSVQYSCDHQYQPCGFCIPGICPNISASPPSGSLSSFILGGIKGPSRKKSLLIPWDIGAGIKTPRSFKTGITVLVSLE